jgi:stage II sporulation protein P
MTINTVFTAIKLVKDKRTRNIIIGVMAGLFMFIFLPIAYFFTNNPVALGINAVKGNYGNIKPIQANITQQQFIDMVAPGAINAHKKYKIFASITIAQAILESSWGHSGLTRKANNMFGVKAFNWTGGSIVMNTNEEYGGVTVTVPAAFRVYTTPSDSIEDHTKFLLENSTYHQHGVFEAKTYEQQAEALKSAGYATESNYPSLLVTLIREYNLDKFDK